MINPPFNVIYISYDGGAMAKRARTNRSYQENLAIRAKVQALMEEGLPESNAQAVAFRMFSNGEIRVKQSLPGAATVAGLLANQLRKKKRTQAAAREADIASSRRSKSGRKKR